MKALRFFLRHSRTGLAFLIGVALGVLLAAPVLGFRLPSDLAAITGAVLGAAITVFGAWSFAHTKEAAHLEALKKCTQSVLQYPIGVLEFAEEREAEFVDTAKSGDRGKIDDRQRSYIESLRVVVEAVSEARALLEGMTSVYHANGALAAMKHREACLALQEAAQDADAVMRADGIREALFMMEIDLARCRLRLCRKKLEEIEREFGDS